VGEGFPFGTKFMRNLPAFFHPLLLLCVGLVFLQPLPAQQSPSIYNVDSLIESVSRLEVEKQAEQLGEWAFKVEPEAGLRLARIALQKAQESEDIRLEGMAFHQLGRLYQLNNNYKKAAQMYEQAYRLRMENASPVEVRQTLTYLVEVYEDLQEFDKAIQYKEADLGYEETNGNTIQLIYGLNHIGQLHTLNRSYSNARKTLNRALELSLASNERLCIADAETYLGQLEVAEQNPSSALRHFLEAKDIHESLQNMSQVANLFDYMGQVYLSLDSIRKARDDYFDEALKIRDDLDDQQARARTLNYIGDTYMREGNYNMALAHYQFSMDDQTASADTSVETMYNMGQAHFKLADLPEAINVLQAGIGLSQRKLEVQQVGRTPRMPLDTFRRNAYNLLFEIYSQSDSLDRAIEYFQKFTGLDDSLFREQKQAEIQSIRLKLESERLQKQEAINANKILEFRTENRVQRTLIYSGLILLLLIIALVIVLYRQTKAKGRVNDQLAFQNKVINTQNRQLHKVNQRLEEAKRAAETANVAKSNFLATMSHEIRTPMNGIIGTTSLFMNTEMNDDQRKYLNTISVSSQNLLSLLNDILDYSRIEAGKLELEIRSTRIRDVVEEVISLFASTANDKGLALKSTIDPDVPTHIFTDSNRLRQVVVNLVSNALKFTASGHIHIKVRPRMLLSGALGHRDPIELEFEVEDTGIGIPDDKLQSIFESFQQVDNSVSRKFGGAGLGLAISRRLVQLMEGAMRVESTTGVGSNFIFYIQTEVDLEAPKAPQPQKKDAHTFNTSLGERFPIRIMVAEDDLINQTVIDGTLKKMGFATTIVSNGQLVLDKLEEEAFDLIFMDIQMPEMDGLTATEEIHSRYEPGKRPVIIAMTANAMTGVREEYLEAGMDDYISKPFQLKDLEETLTRWGTKILAEKPLTGDVSPRA